MTMQQVNATVLDAMRRKFSHIHGKIAVARKLGVDKRTLNKAIANQPIQFIQLCKICNGLDITVEEYYGVHQKNRPHLVSTRQRA